MNKKSSATFKFLKNLNQAPSTKWLSSKTKRSYVILEYCTTDSLQHSLVRALVNAKVIPLKEILECGELFERIRKHVRAPYVADLCCGHGLLGIFFALFEREVEKVFLVDKIEPESRQKLIDCVVSLAPWVADKIINIKDIITPDAQWLQKGTSIVSAHACGSLSDMCISIAQSTGGSLALMPCCYPVSKCQAPEVLVRELGLKTAFDIDRTYRLEKSGYRVRWAHIPEAITPMNRVIMATLIE